MYHMPPSQSVPGQLSADEGKIRGPSPTGQCVRYGCQDGRCAIFYFIGAGELLFSAHTLFLCEYSIYVQPEGGFLQRCARADASRPGNLRSAVRCVAVGANRYSCSCVGVGIGRAWAGVGQLYYNLYISCNLTPDRWHLHLDSGVA